MFSELPSHSRLLIFQQKVNTVHKTYTRFHTQALTENIMVCRSHRIAVAFGAAPAVVDVPDPDVLLLIPVKWMELFNGNYNFSCHYVLPKNQEL